MKRRFVIEDFALKVDLLFRSGRGSVHSLHALSMELTEISMDYLQRLISGRRPLSRQVFLAIAKAAEPAGLRQSDWYESVADFGAKLGISTPVITAVAGGTYGGIDFRSRNADPQNLKTLFGLVGGYWECFYFSVSTFGRQRICHDLVTIEAPNEQGFLPCRIHDASSIYEGYCFPVHTGFLYIMVEKAAVHDEIAVYLVHRPDRAHEPELDGVVICTSSGVDDLIPVPCAARAAFRFLASTQEELIRLHPNIQQHSGEHFETAVRRAIFTPYIDAASINPGDPRRSAIRRCIDNTVQPDQIPFALRMDRVRRNVDR